MNGKLMIVLMLTVLVVGLAGPASAIPVLQLDILEGGYNADKAVESSVNGANNEFTLRAVFTPDKNTTTSLSDFFYISAALVPGSGSKVEPADVNAGYFTFNGTRIEMSSGMLYGVPPVEADLTHDSGDLQTHSVYPTWFVEFPGFKFSDQQKISTYNVQDSEPPSGGTGSFYQDFKVNISGMDFRAIYGLDFDLYTKVALCDGSFKVGINAPFSHDATADPANPVPEPGTMMLLGSSLVGLAGYGRKRFQRV